MEQEHLIMDWSSIEGIFTIHNSSLTVFYRFEGGQNATMENLRESLDVNLE